MSRPCPRAVAVVFVALLVGVVAFVIARKRTGAPAAGPGHPTSLVSRELVDQFTALETREQELNKTVWAKEMLAEGCGRVFESLWDSLNAATNKFGVLAGFEVGEVVPVRFGPPRKLAHGIELREPSGAGPGWSGRQWRRFLEEAEGAGWQIAQAELRHNRFDTDDLGRPRQSRFYFSAHLVRYPNRPLTLPMNPLSRPSGTLSPSEGERDGVRGPTDILPSERAVLEGDLVVDWAPGQSEEKPAAVGRIDASEVTLKTRRGEPSFRPILTAPVTPPEKSYFIDPLILYDLDGDGLSEIILAASNLVYRRRSEDRYESEPLCRYPPGLIFTGIVADFDGDGVADFLCAKFEGLYLFKGSAQGRFDQPGRLVWSADPHLKYAQVLTCGDIDHDGDLDVFLGQYKVPYSRGQMPAPYYDANDGYPSYLLLNDGHGNFTDATAAAGLAKKRWRRTYSASFVDLNEDGNLDLLVVSDFAGVDLYANDGRGRFSDVTREWIAEPHAFGMAHALADFNADGRLDFLMIGMNSPTADRLEHLGLRRGARNAEALLPSSENHKASGVPRPSAFAKAAADGSGTVPTSEAGRDAVKGPAQPAGDSSDGEKMRPRMTFGNRLYLARSKTGFEQTSLGDSIARTGWSWGCSAFDFDNDGFPDVYLANGHETRQSVRDYEPEFWLHDIYAGDSRDDLVASAYFTAKFGRTRGQGWSYGGYEKNRLYLNQRAGSFVETGHLMGVALEEDSRAVVTDDLDGDGRVDLLVTTFEVWPQVKQTLRIFKNTLEDGGNWVGFRLREEGGGVSPVGARVTVRCAGGAAVRQIVTGDSYRSQHANTVHFGLGKNDRVDTVQIQWTDGRSLLLQQPAVNRYHVIAAPEQKSVRQ